MFFRAKRSAEGGLRRRKRASIRKGKGKSGKPGKSGKSEKSGKSGKKSRGKKSGKRKKKAKKPGKKKKKSKSKSKSGSKSSEKSGGSGLDQEVGLKHILLYFCLFQFQTIFSFLTYHPILPSKYILAR